MEILLFKNTKETDLKIGLKVCYQNLQGVYNNLGTITDILDKQHNKEYVLNTSFGSYVASELKLIKSE